MTLTDEELADRVEKTLIGWKPCHGCGTMRDPLWTGCWTGNSDDPIGPFCTRGCMETWRRVVLMGGK